MTQYEGLYGSDYCSPNMHAVLHLADCIRQFGPVHAHWTFPWERMNGCMGSIPMNRHHVEQQFMRTFTRQMVLRSLPSLTGEVLSPDEETLFNSMWGEVKSAQRGFTGRELVTSLGLQVSGRRVTGAEPINASLLKSKVKIFEPKERDWLHDSMALIYPSARAITIDSHYRFAQSLQYYGDTLGTVGSRLHRSSCVLINHGDRAMPAECISFLQPRVTVTFCDGGDVTSEPLLVRAAWFARHSAEGKGPGPMDDTVHTWYVSREHWADAPGGIRCMPPKYVPVHRIRCRYVTAPCTVAIPKGVCKKSRAKGLAPIKIPTPPRLFKTCPLPLQLPF